MNNNNYNSRTVHSVQVIEEDDKDNVAVYNIAVFEDEDSANDLVKQIKEQIDLKIDDIEDADEEFLTPEMCTNEYVKFVLENANLKEGIQVRNCTYRIYVTEETLYS